MIFFDSNLKFDKLPMINSGLLLDIAPLRSGNRDMEIWRG